MKNRNPTGCLSLPLLLILVLSIVVVPMVSASPEQRGPRIDTLRFKVIESPAAKFVEMKHGPPSGCDVWTSPIRQPWAFSHMYQALADRGMRFGHARAMDAQGKTVSIREAFHIGLFGFNYRMTPLDDVNFRHALAHLVPKDYIIQTFFKYTASRIDTLVPPTQALWYNPHVDPHPYSRTEAEDILTAAGYQKIGGVWHMPDGSPIPLLRVYSPPSDPVANIFVAEAVAIGLTSIELEPMGFSTYMDLIFDDWDFEIFWYCWTLGRSPTQLYSFFYSENNFKGSQNPYGINYAALDDEIEAFYYGLDHPVKVAAARTAQELLMGGTSTDPLAKPAQPERNQAMPTIPVYSRIAYSALHPSLREAVNMPGYGINNMWTWMNIHWNTPNEYRPDTTRRMVVATLDEYPETLNPTAARTVYSWTFMDPTFDGLIAVNPYTLRVLPWLGTSWSYAAEPGGMYVKFNLRTIDNHGEPIRWQDGDPIAASDVKFAWDFLHDNEIPRYWDDMKHYINSEIAGTQITAHMSTTSQWLAYSLAGTALMFPPQVWQVWDGQPTADIEAWDPSAVPGPGGLPTSVYGTGPFILQHSTTGIQTTGYGDLDANRNYWLWTAEIQDYKTDMFHCAGDVNYDSKIDVPGDLYRIGAAWHKGEGDPGWDADADICGPLGGPPDLYIDIDDMSTAGKFYGETKHVPHS